MTSQSSSDRSSRVADPVDQRTVFRQHGRPVHVGHVRGPVVVAHQPAGLVVHLPPHRGRVDLAAQPAQVDLDHRVPVAFGVGLDPPVGRHDPERIAVADQQPAAVAGHVVAVQLADQRRRAALREVPALQLRPAALAVSGRLVLAEQAGLRGLQPDQAAADRAQAAGPGGRDRHRDHPLVDRLRRPPAPAAAGRRAAAVTTTAAAALAVVGGRPTGRLRVERGRRGRAERHHVRPGAAEEGQVEDPVVVDRVERAGGQEGQVQPVEGEHRVGVDEPQRGDLHRRRPVAVGDPAGEDLAQVFRARVRPGQPGRVRRPGQAGRLAVLGAGDLPDLAGGHVGDQHPAVVRGQREPAAVRGRGQLQHPAELAAAEPARRRAAVGRGDLDRVVAVGVGDPGDLRHRVLRGGGGAEHLRQPGPHARGVGQRRGRAVPGGQPVHGAEHLDRAGPAGAVGRDVADLVAGAERAGPAGGARAGQVDLEPPRLRVQPVEQPEVAVHLPDQPGAVGTQRPRVRIAVVAVPAQVGAVRADRVDVAPALVVGDEHDPVADPVRVLQLGRVVAEQPLERAAAVAVDPQLAGGAAAVALPGRAGPPLVGAEHDRAAGTRGDRVTRPVRQALGGGRAVQRQRPGPDPAAERLAGRGARHHPAVRQPAGDPGVRVAPVGQPGGRAARDRHRVHLRRAVPGAGERDRLAVRRQPRAGHRHAVGGQPPRPPAGGVGQPDVVLGDEREPVAADAREAEVRALCSHRHNLASPADTFVRGSRVGVRT